MGTGVITRIRAATGRLAMALRAQLAPAVRGVAEASLLLIDGSGPVFSPYPPGTLRELAFRAAFHAEAG